MRAFDVAAFVPSLWEFTEPVPEGPERVVALVAGGTDYTGKEVVADRPGARPAERIQATALDAFLRLLATPVARGLTDRYGSTTGKELARGIVRKSLPWVTGSAIVDAGDLGAGS